MCIDKVMPLVCFSASAKPATQGPLIVGAGLRVGIRVDAGRDLGVRRWRMKSVSCCSSFGADDISSTLIAQFVPTVLSVYPHFLNSPDKVVHGTHQQTRLSSSDSRVQFMTTPVHFLGSTPAADQHMITVLNQSVDYDFGEHCVDSRNMFIEIDMTTAGNVGFGAQGLPSVDPQVITGTLMCFHGVFEYT